LSLSSYHRPLGGAGLCAHFRERPVKAFAMPSDNIYRRSASAERSGVGEYDLSFHGTVISPEHARHVDSRLTQKHEKTHRDLTFSSTYGFFSFIVAQIARYHPDPIRRY